jgi:hypothetical protein
VITATQLVAHAVGDYLLQSDWMANEKTKKSVAALAHAVMYTLPFLFLTTSWKALLFIAGTHFIIDRWRLARYVVWAKNFLAPRESVEPPHVFSKLEAAHPTVEVGNVLAFADGQQRVLEVHSDKCFVAQKFTTWWHPWRECVGTGYHKDRPPFIAVWLLIIADNTMHVLLNGLALRYL